MEFSKYLKKCRENSNITQEELVSELYSFDEKTFENLDTVTLSRWARHTTTPNGIKQLGIIRFFQKYTKEALPYWDSYSVTEVEDLICTAGINNIIVKTKQLVLNFPSEMMKIDNMKVYPIRDFEKADVLFDLNMDLHNATNSTYTKVELEQFKSWAMHPSNLFLACEYKDNFVGLFFSVRVKEEVFEKLMNFEMKKSDITESDFAIHDEKGSTLLLSFYAINVKIATLLFVRNYAYLIANQKTISEVGVITTLPEVKKTVLNMNLEFYKNKTIDKNTDIEVYRQKLGKVLASEYVVKMIFTE